ncbi:MAG: hemolysin III family protein [Candidatus Thorarchaeota archaeon]
MLVNELLKEERFAAYSHLIGSIAALVGSIFLIVISAINKSNVIVAVVYGFSITFLFIASTLYHALKKEENEYSIWRILDHIAIFFMIAGTYTPLVYIYLTGAWRWGIIAAQWALVVLGIIFKPFVLNVPRWVETQVYLLMGWMAILPIYQFITLMPVTVLILIFIGGLAFTIGAILHIINKEIIPSVFSFHDIFHILIIVGGACHYFAVYIAISASI